MQGLKTGGAVVAGTIVAVVVFSVAALPNTASARQVRHCQPIVKKIFTNEGFYKAKVLIVHGDVSCREARKVLWKALTAGGTYGPVGNGWECVSKGQSGALAEKCFRLGRDPAREVIKTARPRPCPSCHANRS